MFYWGFGRDYDCHIVFIIFLFQKNIILSHVHIVQHKDYSLPFLEAGYGHEKMWSRKYKKCHGIALRSALWPLLCIPFLYSTEEQRCCHLACAMRVTAWTGTQVFNYGNFKVLREKKQNSKEIQGRYEIQETLPSLKWNPHREADCHWSRKSKAQERMPSSRR